SRNCDPHGDGRGRVTAGPPTGGRIVAVGWHCGRVRYGFGWVDSAGAGAECAGESASSWRDPDGCARTRLRRFAVDSHWTGVRPVTGVAICPGGRERSVEGEQPQRYRGPPWGTATEPAGQRRGWSE